MSLPMLLRSLVSAFLLSAGPLCVQAEPALLRDIQLQDHRARPVLPASLEGKPLLLNFVFTGCSTTCSLQTRQLAQLVRGLPPVARSKVQVLSVSVDPLSDTPQTLAAFAQRQDADLPGWRFATGAPAQVERLLARVRGVVSRAGPERPEDHRTSLYLFDADGALVQRFAGVPVDIPRLTDELTRLVHRPSH